ncbi:unnamed protein product [Calypogeia fissa]
MTNGGRYHQSRDDSWRVPCVVAWARWRFGLRGGPKAVLLIYDPAKPDEESNGDGDHPGGGAPYRVAPYFPWRNADRKTSASSWSQTVLRVSATRANNRFLFASHQLLHPQSRS